MTKKSTDIVVESETHFVQTQNHQNVFADRILNFAMSASVTKLNFANELASNKHSVHLTVTIPTFALIEAIDFLSNTIDSDENMSAEILAKLEQFKNRLEQKRGKM